MPIHFRGLPSRKTRKQPFVVNNDFLDCAASSAAKAGVGMRQLIGICCEGRLKTPDVFEHNLMRKPNTQTEPP